MQNNPCHLTTVYVFTVCLLVFFFFIQRYITGGKIQASVLNSVWESSLSTYLIGI